GAGLQVLVEPLAALREIVLPPVCLDAAEGGEPGAPAQVWRELRGPQPHQGVDLRIGEVPGGLAGAAFPFLAEAAGAPRQAGDGDRALAEAVGERRREAVLDHGLARA